MKNFFGAVLVLIGMGVTFQVLPNLERVLDAEGRFRLEMTNSAFASQTASSPLSSSFSRVEYDAHSTAMRVAKDTEHDEERELTLAAAAAGLGFYLLYRGWIQ